MSNRRLRSAIPALAFALVATACGGDDEAADTTLAASTTVADTTTSAAPTTDAETTTSAAATTAPATTTPADGSADLPAATTPPDGSADVPLPPVDSVDVPLLIEVEVGTDNAEDRVETVLAGSVVTISIVNPNADDEFHLHEYDLGDGQLVPAGQTATFTFVADRLGDFELESHLTDEVYMVLRVV